MTAREPSTNPRSRGIGERASETRDRILDAAERLFAERGVGAVSNRQVSETAGQSNNSAVGYHVGTKSDLVLAVFQRHSEPMEHRRFEMLHTRTTTPDLRECVSSLVRPVTEHLEALGSPTWYARFASQVMADPFWRLIVLDDTVTPPSLRDASQELARLVPPLPVDVGRERGDMTRHLIIHMCAERERALCEGEPTPRKTWDATASGLIDAIVGLWLAPVTGT